MGYTPLGIHKCDCGTLIPNPQIMKCPVCKRLTPEGKKEKVRLKIQRDPEGAKYLKQRLEMKHAIRDGT